MPEARFAVGALVSGTPPLARVLTRVDWRHDGDGIVDRHTHLYVQPARPGARARRLTHGDWSVESFAWAPDGTRIAFSADQGERADIDAAPAVYAVAARGGEPVELARLAGSCGGVSWSPDGAHVAFLGIDEAGEPYGCEESLWVVPAAGGAPRDLAPGRHLHLWLTLASDLVDWEVGTGGHLAWDGAGAVVCPLTTEGQSALWRFPLDGEPAPAAGGEAHIHGYALGGGRLVTVRAAETGVVELYGEDSGARRGGSRATARRGGGRSPASPTSRSRFPGRPGRSARRSPRRAAPGAGCCRSCSRSSAGRVEAGGPEPWLPDWALTAAGTRMLMPDPRGSASYGRAWLEAIRGDWGGADAEDQLACVDWAVGEGHADPARLGVTGLSYGGFMTHWLISRRPLSRGRGRRTAWSNQISSVANCDQGTLWTPRLGLGRPPADSERLWQQSPLAHADRITTPLLMLQGEADLRCPPADNEQLFVALRALGRPVEYVLYPEESHLMQATARPDRRIDMLERTRALVQVAWRAPSRVGRARRRIHERVGVRSSVMAADQPSDAELLAAAAAGDAEAFCGIYDRYGAPLARWFARSVGEAAAADLAAETVAAAWRARRQFRDDGSGSAAPWLFAIARNVLRDSLRKGRREDRARLRLGLPTDLGEERGFDDVDARLSPSPALSAALAALGAGEREVVALRVIDELGYDEIARRLDIRPAAARLRVSRALRRLRTALAGGEHP